MRGIVFPFLSPHFSCSVLEDKEGIDTKFWWRFDHFVKHRTVTMLELPKEVWHLNRGLVYTLTHSLIHSPNHLLSALKAANKRDSVAARQTKNARCKAWIFSENGGW